MAGNITRVISGGQTGADIAGLKAAHICGIPTGGTAPKGWRTLQGPNPDLGRIYGLVEHRSSDYRYRTEENVKNSDGTIRFARYFDSPGEKCTIRAIRKHKKPYLDVDTDSPPDIGAVVTWMRASNIAVLNVAGNSEETAWGIEEAVTIYLVRLFRELGLRPI